MALKDELAAAKTQIAELQARLGSAPGGEGPSVSTPAPIDEAPAYNVIDAISRVKRDLPGIGKTRDPGSDIKYAFRGIEALTAHLQGLTAHHGVVTVQLGATELATGYEYTTSTGTVWHEAHIHYRWATYGPGGLEDVIYGESIGYGRDNSDKGASKASTQAYKEYLVKLFCIGDKSSDGDAQVTDEQTGQQRSNDTDGRTFGTGQPPATPDIDWHALGWAPDPLPSGAGPGRTAAREMHDAALKDITAVMKEHLPEDKIKQLIADRKKTIGELPFSVDQVRSWERMADAAITEHTGEDADGNQVESGSALAAAFPGSTRENYDENGAGEG